MLELLPPAAQQLCCNGSLRSAFFLLRNTNRLECVLVLGVCGVARTCTWQLLLYFSGQFAIATRHAKQLFLLIVPPDWRNDVAGLRNRM